MTHYHYAYILYEKSGYHWGIYQNFKKAYERLEELAKGNPIVDCGDDFINTSAVFNVIKITRHGKSIQIKTDEYHILQVCLTIDDNDIVVTAKMLNKLHDENKERSRNSKYRLNAEAI